LEDLKRIFTDFNTENINTLNEAIGKIKFSDKNIENVGKLTEAISKLVEKLKELDG